MVIKSKRIKSDTPRLTAATFSKNFRPNFVLDGACRAGTLAEFAVRYELVIFLRFPYFLRAFRRVFATKVGVRPLLVKVDNLRSGRYEFFSSTVGVHMPT